MIAHIIVGGATSDTNQRSYLYADEHVEFDFDDAETLAHDIGNVVAESIVHAARMGVGHLTITSNVDNLEPAPKIFVIEEVHRNEVEARTREEAVAIWRDKYGDVIDGSSILSVNEKKED